MESIIWVLICITWTTKYRIIISQLSSHYSFKRKKIPATHAVVSQWKSISDKIYQTTRLGYIYRYIPQWVIGSKVYDILQWTRHFVRYFCYGQAQKFGATVFLEYPIIMCHRFPCFLPPTQPHPKPSNTIVRIYS